MHDLIAADVSTELPESLHVKEHKRRGPGNQNRSGQPFGRRHDPHGPRDQGQRTLRVLASKDLHHVVHVPARHSSLHDVAFLTWVLLD